MQLHAGKPTPIENKDSFSEAVEPFISDLRRYCISLTKSKWSGEDLVQEALTKAYKTWLKQPKSMTKAYLLRIASNHWIDEYRKRKVDIDYKDNLSHIAQEKRVVTYEIEAAIEVILNHLSLKQRAVFLLIEGFDYRANEVAEMLEMTEGAVKAALHRARKKLNDLCEEDQILNERDDEEASVYVKAFCSGLPHLVVNAYRNRMNEPQMLLNESNLGNGDLFIGKVTEIKGSHSSYFIVTIPVKGGLMFVPVYQKEIAVLLGWAEDFMKLTQRSQRFAA